MNTETYIVMRGSKVLGYIEAYTSYHALQIAHKLYSIYGKDLIIEKITHNCPA